MHPVELKDKNILLTGGSGFIGSHLLKELSKKFLRSNIFAISRNTNLPLKMKNVNWLTVKLSQLSKSFWSKQKINHFHFVLHLGAFTPKNHLEANKTDEMFENNILGTKALLDSLPSPPKKFIFSSSLDVYEPSHGKKIDENSPTNPISFYGATKLFGESLVKAHANEHNYDYTILRYGHIYGPGENKYKKLIPEVIRTLLKKDNPTLYGSPKTLRDFLFVDDAVEATLRALTCAERGPINIVSGTSFPIMEIIKTLIKISGFKLKIQQVNPEAPGYSHRFSNKIMKKNLGHWPYVPLQVGLKKEWDSMKKNENRV